MHITLIDRTEIKLSGVQASKPNDETEYEDMDMNTYRDEPAEESSAVYEVIKPSSSHPSPSLAVHLPDVKYDIVSPRKDSVDSSFQYAECVAYATH